MFNQDNNGYDPDDSSSGYGNFIIISNSSRLFMILFCISESDNEQNVSAPHADPAMGNYL